MHCTVGASQILYTVRQQLFLMSDYMNMKSLKKIATFCHTGCTVTQHRFVVLILESIKQFHIAILFPVLYQLAAAHLEAVINPLLLSMCCTFLSCHDETLQRLFLCCSNSTHCSSFKKNACITNSSIHPFRTKQAVHIGRLVELCSNVAAVLVTVELHVRES